MKKVYFLLVFIVCSCTAFPQIIRYVDSSSTQPVALRTGFGWVSAFKDLTEAFQYIKQNPGRYELRIAKGTYKPSAVGYDDTCFVIAGAAVDMYGGYPSKGNGVRDPAANPTILTGEVGYSNGNNQSKRTSHVILALHIPANQPIVFDGLTIADGTDNSGQKNYDGEWVENYIGSGIFLHHLPGLATVRNCTFLRNDGSDGAGLGVAGNNATTSTIVENCVFQDNKGLFGTGIYVDSSDHIRVINCTFLNNRASDGAGVRIRNSSNAIISGCSFLKGFAASGGGGVATDGAFSVDITECLFKENYAGNLPNLTITGGGAIDNNHSNIRISNCVFYKDSAVYGGAINNSDGANASITNCHFVANYGLKYGGVLGNSNGSSSRVSNCILWNNQAASSPVAFNDANSTSSFSYSLVQGGYGGTGNINADPKFVNGADIDGADNIFGTADDGLKLQDVSPAINRGNNSIASGLTTDISGSPRFQAESVDMGAYESPIKTSVLYVDNALSASGSGFSWNAGFKEFREATASAMKDDRVTSIAVAKGTYKPTNNASRDSSFVLTRGVKMYGGYPTGGGVRNPVLYPTILSGDIGTANASSDNSYHVLVASGLPATEDSLVLDGFTITNGNANGTGSKTFNGQTFNRDDGAGVSIKSINNKTVFRNCVFSSNICTGNGAAVFNYAASPFFFNCLLTGNKAAYGGAIANETQSAPQLTNCTLARDTATANGGGMYNNNFSNPLITNCIIWDNATATNSVIGNGATSNPQVNTSIVQTTIYFFGGNLNADPLFVNPATGNFQLQGCSPGINAGNSTAVPSGITTDLLGNPRFFNAAVDMGAYENVTLPTTFTFKGTGNWTVIGNWQCNWVPPASLPSGSEIIIDPTGGDCILNIPYTLPAGGKLTVRTGKKLKVQ